METIPVYVANLRRRKDRKESILRQFEGKSIFELNIVPAKEWKNGSWALWQTFYEIVESEYKKQSKFFIFCEDDHVFTENYSETYLEKSIIDAQSMDADLLSGGMSVVGKSVQVNDNLFWVDSFNGMQFTIIFNRLYERIIDSKTSEGYVTDIHLSSLAKRKFVMYPYISIQKEFGYSDATETNNDKGKVDRFFHKTQETLETLCKVRTFYKKVNHHAVQSICNMNVSKYVVPTYIIHLKNRADRLQNIEGQFRDRPEFQIHIVDACEETNGALGLWKSLCSIIQKAKANDEDFLVVCEDDHIFTENYNRTDFLRKIMLGGILGAEILNGGVSNFGNLVPLVGNGLFWVDWFWCTQFIVVYKKAYDIILHADYGARDVADMKLSTICKNKFAIVPFISEQKDFGYSDITEVNNKDSMLMRHFSSCKQKLKHYTFALSLKERQSEPFEEVGIHWKKYLGKDGVKALQLGCGVNLLEGWLNTDLVPTYGASFMDVLQPFPMQDNCLDYIFAEHLLEFFPPFNLEKVLQECYRVLKEKGVLRIVVFSIDKIVTATSNDEEYNAYASWNLSYYGKMWQESILCKNGYIPMNLLISNFMSKYNELQCYDYGTLQTLLNAIGFNEIRPASTNVSRQDFLKNIDGYKSYKPQRFYEYEVLVVECVK